MPQSPQQNLIATTAVLPRVAGVLSTLLTLAYPLVVWQLFATPSAAPYFAALLMMMGAVRLLLWWAGLSRSRFFPPWLSLSLAMVMLGLGAWVLWFGQVTVFQLYPLLVSGLFLLVFAMSLFSSQSLIERFASAYEGQLSARKRRYLRRVTQCWCGFFVLNMALSAYTWLVMTPTAWAWYNGVISYVLMAMMFAGEYLYRRLIFLPAEGA